MHRSAACLILGLLFGTAAVFLVGCTGPKAFIRESSADEVEVSDAGDLAGATTLARAHCARFERSARLRHADTEAAVFDCVKP